jgi:cell division septation protein DedD
LNASGAQVDNKDGAIDLDDLDHKTYVLTLPELPPGTYTVEWASLSDEDGENDEGSFSFTIQGQAQPTAAPASTAAPAGTAVPASTSVPAGTAAPTPRATTAPAATAAPANLPRTGESGSNVGWYILLGAMVLLIAGLALRGGKHSTR